MRKFILTALLMFLMCSPAHADGFKGLIGIESVSEVSRTTHTEVTGITRYSDNYNYAGIRLGAAYEASVIGPICVEVATSTNLFAEGRAEANLVVPVSSKTKLKAGVNVTKKIYGASGMEYRAENGLQAAIETDIAEDRFVTLQVSQTQHEYQATSPVASHLYEKDQTSVMVGIGFRF